MLNPCSAPAETGFDGQWAISVQHTREDIDANIDAFKEAAEIEKTFEESMPVVEAI